MRLISIIGVTLLVALSLHTPSAQADMPPPPYATITYSDQSSVIAPGTGGTFPLIGVQAGQAVQVQIDYPSNDALQIIILRALDGGAVLPPGSVTTVQTTGPPAVSSALALPIDNNATLAFTFVPGSNPGSYRVMLQHNGTSMRLEFWVLDSANPQNNPPAITPATPENY